MRQAGILAAAGIVALQKMVSRLGQDHMRARHLAEGLSEIPSLVLDPGTPATNMIFFNLTERVKLSTAQVEAEMKKKGVLVHASDERRFRLVTHYWIDDQAVDRTVEAFRAVLA